ncbi:MFS general substrate transporter [Hyaloscypha variabilis F]|uniref:MFS general substrate transporter n=1 Tax=Hyaloscypha variabilis (strain UAMH 11265 / GT02V1 / F) TaxID=1149755 RepID=A0A2J6RS54_HYAVF|nr:MFS general substrate transporter [Hyaloscypha variabilis F]
MAPNNHKKGEVHNVNIVAEEVDREREEQLIRKMDLHLIPLIMLMYLFSFLDRINLGNARLYGLEKDLKMAPESNEYQIAVSILFVTYCLFEVPSNLLLKKIGPSRYITILGIAWGLIAPLSGLTRTYHELLACRVLLGLFESGLFPVLIIYLTLFYNKTWRWIFIIEGLPPIVVGILFWILMPNDLDTATFLSPEDRAFLVMRRGREVGQIASAQKFHWDDVREGASDWKVWSFSLAQFGSDTMLYGFTQALTIPVYALGAITYLVIAWVSDKSQQRALYTCVFCAVSIVGYGLLLSNSGSKVHYTGCFLVAMGLYVAIWKRTFAIGLQVTIENTSGIMAPFLYSATGGPRYVKGHSITLALVGFAAVVYALMSWWLRRENRARMLLERNDFNEGNLMQGINNVGDRNPRFLYTC